MAEDAVRISMQPDDLSLETLPELDGDLTNWEESELCEKHENLGAIGSSKQSMRLEMTAGGNGIRARIRL